jgi:hypothetical protein
VQKSHNVQQFAQTAMRKIANLDRDGTTYRWSEAQLRQKDETPIPEQAYCPKSRRRQIVQPSNP